MWFFVNRGEVDGKWELDGDGDWEIVFLGGSWNMGFISLLIERVWEKSMKGKG